MQAFISVIILAAGQAKRMGKLKQLLPYGSRTMLEHVTDTYLASSAGQVIVVLGAGAEEAIHVIGQRRVAMVINERYEEGMSTSIIKGLKMADDRARGILFALADQPLIDTATIDQLIDAFSAAEKGIVVPVYLARRGNPVIIDIKYKKELEALRGDKGGKEILSRHPDDVLEIPVSCEGVIADIDTLEDYRRARDNAGDTGSLQINE